MLLDDDDLLVPDCLESVFHAFEKFPDIDCLFLGVHPFGPYAAGPAKNRNTALSKMIDQLKPEEHDGLYFFNQNLFDVLLKTVPIDFQRPAARRGAWNIVGGFDEGSLFSESTWTIRASSICKIALTNKALTQWRIHGSNFGWPPNLELEKIRIRQIDNGINMSEHLLNFFRSGKGYSMIKPGKLRDITLLHIFQKQIIYAIKTKWKD